MRELIRLAKKSCEVALRQKATQIDLKIAEEAVREVRKIYFIEDYHFPELSTVHRTGELSSNTFDSPNGKIVICDELLHYKLILGYQDPEKGRWFDINPILIDDLGRWQNLTFSNIKKSESEDIPDIDSTVLTALEELSIVYNKYLEDKDYAKVAETANSAYEMCQELVESITPNTSTYQKMIALLSYWKLNRDLYRGLA